MHVIAFGLLLPSAAWTLPQARFTPAALASVAIMGVCTSGLAYWAYMRIVQKVSPIAALSSTFMATISGIIWGHLVLDEKFTGTTYAGGLLVLAATALLGDGHEVRLLAREGTRLHLAYDPEASPTPAVLARLAAALPVRDVFVEEAPIEELVAKLYRELAEEPAAEPAEHPDAAPAEDPAG